jgi:hypothetical protein
LVRKASIGKYALVYFFQLSMIAKKKPNIWPKRPDSHPFFEYNGNRFDEVETLKLKLWPGLEKRESRK